MMFKIPFLVVATVTFFVAFGSSEVRAQSCTGVEARVNAKTSALATAITSQITARTSAVVAQETLQRTELLSAMRLMVRQESLSTEQEVKADNASQMALANVIVEDSVARQIHEAVTDYGSIGHGACELIEAGETIADMMDNYATARAEMAEQIRQNRSPETEPEYREMMAAWSAIVADSDDATVDGLLSGDEEAAKTFMAVVAGPPRYPEEAQSGSVIANMDRVLALRDEARNSAAVTALAELAASEGLREALEAQSDIWVGEDGGLEWAAKMAASPTRAALLDTARIEAHNIAVAALELRQGVMNEFALASFALSYIDDQRDRQRFTEAQ